MAVDTYEFPSFLVGQTTRAAYLRWLHRKAMAHVKRDRKRVTTPLTVSAYKQSIHQAVIDSGGMDWYTGETLNWSLISTYDNDASRAGRSVYKAGFALLPTVDHVSGEDGVFDFVICGWRTNDAKNDLSLVELLDLCRKILAHRGQVS